MSAVSTPSGQARDYRSVAASVHTQLVKLRVGESSPAAGVDRFASERAQTIKDLLGVARRYSARPDGRLPGTGMTPERSALADEIVSLIPAAAGPSGQSFELDAWIDRAEPLLDRAGGLAPEISPSPDDLRFIQIELEGFLEAIIFLPHARPGCF